MGVLRHSVVDTIQWRVIAFLIDLIVLTVVIGDPFKSSGIAVLLTILKTVVFFMWRLVRERQRTV